MFLLAWNQTTIMQNASSALIIKFHLIQTRTKQKLTWHCSKYNKWNEEYNLLPYNTRQGPKCRLAPAEFVM
jgi:hypothetical protein